jgi:hypothetical protein
MMENEYDPHPDFGITPAQYHAGLSKLWDALNVSSNPTGEDVFTLAARAIEDAQQKPSRREIAARAMQGLLSNPEMVSDINRSRVAQMAIDEADQLIHYLTIAQELESQGGDTIAEGLNLLPMYSRELDEGLTNE